MTPLCELADKYKTDKWAYHNYTPIYYGMLGPRRSSIKRVLEIGIGDEFSVSRGFTIGASLRMWEEFFPSAEIIGFDNNLDSMINEGRIRSVFCDQSSEQSLLGAVARAGGVPFDLIIDDGSHHIEDQILSMKVLLPYLVRYGFYVIEDVVKTVKVVEQTPPCYISTVLITGNKLDDNLVVIREVD